MSWWLLAADEEALRQGAVMKYMLCVCRSRDYMRNVCTFLSDLLYPKKQTNKQVNTHIKQLL